MPLPSGSRLGHYDIRSLVGAGGMGEVYRARDSRLGRDVAVKILPHEFTMDADRVARFEREARVLAALNHPNIATIHGVEESTGVRALVMELVEGETLADRLARGPLPLATALPLVRQIAEALDAAHERGVVHRDLKPANVKVTPAGVVKVLDFGIAKALEGTDSDASAAPTVTALETRDGLVLGTAAYMSPEQARGQAVDKRTDVWAFGCVLYEVLTGRHAFRGDTLSDTIAGVLEREPDWTRLPAGTPAGIHRLLRRCLEKDTRRRLRDIGDARLELEEAPSLDIEPGAVARSDGTARRIPGWALAATALAAAGGIGVAGWILLGSRDGPIAPVTRATLTLPADQELATVGRPGPPVVSPDGRRLVYLARGAGGVQQLYLRDLDAFDAKPLAGTEGARHPFFSPDGQWVAFFAAGKLKRVSTQGGSPVDVCDAPLVGRGGTWGPDGTIVFALTGNGGLVRVAAAGGSPEPVTSQDGAMDDRSLSWPHFLPHGRALLATATIDGASVLAVLSFDTGTWRLLGRGSEAQYMPPGYLVFHAPDVREGELHAVPFDVDGLTVLGEPVSVLDGVFRASNNGGLQFAVTRTGTLVFAPGGHARTLVRVDRNGRRTPLLDDRRGFRVPRVSPDGRRLTVTVDPRPSQVWVYDLTRRSGIPLAAGGHNLGSLWLDDSNVAYTFNGDIHSRAADASREARRLLARPRPQYAVSWSAKGHTLLFEDDHPANGVDIWVMPIDGDPRPLLAGRASERSPRLSRDERWLAYVSDESGRDEVYVRPFPDVEAGKWIVSSGGGAPPVWSPAGDELFYMNGTAMMSVAIDARAATFSPSAPVQLFQGPFFTGSPHFDISPDGEYFVMVEADPGAQPTQVHIVLNWIEELKALVTTAR